MKCENCSHAEMCKWIDQLGGRGCDFCDEKPCELLILKSDIFLHQDDKKKWAESIEREREKGLIILPPYFTPLLIPNDVEIRIEKEPCDDAVSREAFITRYREWMKSEYGKTPDDDTLAIRVIKSLPSVTQKSGKWIPIYQGDEIINYRCSECELGDTNGSTNLYGWDYCRRCGAKMVEPQESEE